MKFKNEVNVVIPFDSPECCKDENDIFMKILEETCAHGSRSSNDIENTDLVYDVERKEVFL